MKPSEELANRLHSAALHLLRRLRREDGASGLTAPKLSALSVIVFGGPVSISDLARAEQVRVPTISRLVSSLEEQELIKRQKDKYDDRTVRLTATAKGRKLLEEGRARRVTLLSANLERLSAADRKILGKAADILDQLTLPETYPGKATSG